MAAEPPRVEQECVEGYLFSGRPPRILLFRRPPMRGGVWVPISGKVEADDEDFPAALRRELLEETGLSEPVRLFELGWEFPFTGPDGRPWRLHAYGVELGSEVEPVLSDEHDAFEWLDAEPAIARLHYEDNQAALRLLIEQIDREAAGAAPAAL